MFPTLFKFGPLTLHTYGLMVGLGFILAFGVARRQFRDKGWPEMLLEKIVLCLMVFGLLGARLMYFTVDGFRGLRSDPSAFFRIWEGGLVFYGGAIAGVLTLIVFSRLKRIPFFALTDIFAAPLLLGHALGRVGCFAAGCCYGRPTDSIFGVTFTNVDALAPLGVRLHPTQLYESLGVFVLFIGALILWKRKAREGLITASYLVGYGVFRFLIEFLRGDDRGFVEASLYPSQIIALAAIFLGVALYVRVQTKKA